MKAVRVLLVDTNERYLPLFERALQRPDSLRLVVTWSSSRAAEATYHTAGEPFDIVLLGGRLTPATATALAKVFRVANPIMPIFLLTEEAGVQLPAGLRKAGVDDVLDASEIDSPLFAWTFTSTLEHAALRKKAHEYDTLHQRILSATGMLAGIMHDISNPISIIRLALYHLGNPDLPPEKRETFLKFLADNVDRVESRMKELRHIRRQLGEDAGAGAKILSIKTKERLAALR